MRKTAVEKGQQLQQRQQEQHSEEKAGDRNARRRPFYSIDQEYQPKLLANLCLLFKSCRA
jgi:hypothetical protein